MVCWLRWEPAGSGVGVPQTRMQAHWIGLRGPHCSPSTPHQPTCVTRRSVVYSREHCTALAASLSRAASPSRNTCSVWVGVERVWGVALRVRVEKRNRQAPGMPARGK